MSFVVATTQRSALDYHAEALAAHGMLRRYFVGVRRPAEGIPSELTSRNLLWGGVTTASSMLLPGYTAECIRADMHPWFDRWVTAQLKAGDNIISSYGYANKAFKKVKKNGGFTMVDAGNSHPAYYWEVVSEEHKIWGVKRPPYPRHWNRQALDMMEDTDYVICPSRFVERTFLDRGFTPQQLLYVPYPTDLNLFRPKPDDIPPPAPLVVVSTGSVSLRKGFPYLLEAMRMISADRKVKLLLTDQVEPKMREILATYDDIPIEWAPTLGHRELAARLRSAHVFALLSIEDGFARTVTEALGCGIPAVITTNTGAMDFIVEGKNGYVIPIRDSNAAAEAIVKASTLRPSEAAENSGLPDLSFAGFEKTFFDEMNLKGLLPQNP